MGVQTFAQNFTATGDGVETVVKNCDKVNYSVSGTFAGTVEFQKSHDGRQSWDVVDTISTTQAAVEWENTKGGDAYVRFVCTVYTSGTIETSIAEQPKVVEVFKNKVTGETVMTLTESGVDIPGALTAGSLSGALGTGLFDDGSVGAPSISFSSDTDTGTFLSGGVVRYAFGGTEIFQYGPVGLNVSGAGTILRVQDGTQAAPAITWATGADTDTGIYRQGNDTWRVATGGAFAFGIDASQNVTIPGGDFTVTRDDSGAIVGLNLVNVSNTAGSDARLRLSVGGISAGDPYIYFEGFGQAAIGVDNSDGDKFKFTHGADLDTNLVAEYGDTLWTFATGVTVEIDGTLNHDGTTAGFMGATPVAQAAHIADSAGDDAAAVNAILVVLENLGFVATS